MSTKGRTLLVATPTKREPRHSSCRVELCACHDFQPDTATSAVDSDQQTSSLIRWLSGASLPKIDDERVKTQSNHCPNRLHASIAILNAIRDACRQFLEAPPSVGTSPFPKDDNNKHPNFNDKTYEDSFPSLPSLSSASPPTLLVGRKKNKGPKISSDTNGGGNISNSWNATNSSITANIQSQNAINATKQSNGCHMTASGNATSVSPAASNSPIRQTFNSLTFASESMRSSSPKMGMQFFMDNKICSDGAEKFGIDGDPNTGIDEFIQQKSERLVLIYVAILRSQLAPSLLLEFHLLLRLLSLSDKNLTRKKTDTDGTQPYHDIFHYEQSCRDFAAKTLTDLESVIVNLGHETLKMLVAFPALQMHCRRLCMTMQDIIHAGKSALIFDADRKALGHTTNTPHLTLPFDHARDSRHNYRSAQLNMIFKEREELRDSFLFQLRGFQDIRGRLMEQEQAEKSIVSLQQASREILSSVSPGNTYWFVNFVCDLLLQTGLAPISETDSEVLRQIGDKKRLQKLHMRFTSTNAQTNRSSKTLLIDQRGSLTNTAATPDQSFTGHQEFFSIFIRAGNSYTFNMHFKNRLAQLINEMTAVKETKDLCEYMAKTQMLAKFLGMLDFSPNWELAADSIPDRDYDLTSSINIRKCIEDAWIHNRLVVVIPWVTQYLGMMKWDAVSRKFPYYIDTFALLLSIKHRCFPYQLSSHSFYQTNMMQVSLQLEALFRDVVGLAPSQHLDILNIPPRKSATPESAVLLPLDDLPLWFSQHTSTSLIPHLKDLHDILKDLAQNNDKVANTAPKKVRPDTITNLEGMEPNLISQIVLSGQMSPWSTKRSRTPNKNAGIRERLVDSFFHQHKDLQQLCEIVVDRAIKNFAHTATHACIIPIFKHEAASFEDYFNKSPRMTLEEYTKLLNVLDSKAEEAATTLMKDHFDRTITGTLHLLAPPETQTKVVEVASSLAISHAFQQGRNIIHSVIHQEKKKCVEEFIRKEKKFLAGVPLNASKRDRSVEGDIIQSGNSFHNLAVLTASLSRLQKMEVDDSAGIDIVLTSLKGEAKKAIEYLQRYFIGAGIPPAVLDFELHILSILKSFFTNPSYRHLLGAVIEVTEVLSLLGKLGYADASKQELESLLCCDIDNMLTLIGAKNHGMSGEPNMITCESIGSFLFVLLEGSIICSRSLESALLHAATVNDDAKLVSHVVLNKLSVSRTGMADSSGRLVIMVRLQRVLSADTIIT